ncbi:hypothetical protein K490DRAFT_59725 [Saccharata proteae CBS 121410]|uniref:Uncharacterized protein n=1 Tax=Saccharata proteae CBS 121410 TaxID=1314787 RepID=A0A9P4HPH5_9PEZI|nr:hypothetical protein K490DRAFT_59725 [Saccharata proteae CBS 121410]
MLAVLQTERREHVQRAANVHEARGGLRAVRLWNALRNGRWTCPPMTTLKAKGERCARIAVRLICDSPFQISSPVACRDNVNSIVVGEANDGPGFYIVIPSRKRISLPRLCPAQPFKVPYGRFCHPRSQTPIECTAIRARATTDLIARWPFLGSTRAYLKASGAGV